ncbi:MAG: hypothetical protein ACPL4N_02015 [Candidatus Norongarragalinales archaeon]
MAVPGKVTRVMKAGVEVTYFDGSKRKAAAICVKPRKDDYVIVQAKTIQKIVPRKEALAAISAWKKCV